MKTAKNILIAFILNFSFSLFELIGGLFTGSIAIISDSVHDFADAISIAIAFFLEKKSKKRPDHKYTYGYARYSILGAFITTVILIIGSVVVICGAVGRIFVPEEINYDGMIGIAIIGVVINYIAARITHGSKSLNQKSVNLHMLEDVLGWVVVLAGAIIMKFTDITLIDPIMSIGVALFIFIAALKNFGAILNLFLIKTPSGISVSDILGHLKNIKGVEDIHHFHVWSMDGQNNYATMHVVTSVKNTSELKDALRAEASEHGIGHITIEIEAPSDHCHDKECHPAVAEAGSHHHHH